MITEEFTTNASSIIREAIYNKEEENLMVRFVNGKAYRYKNVPENIWKDFKNSHSKGKYFHSAIRNDYTGIESIDDYKSPYDK